jgi:hypothetical protein
MALRPPLFPRGMDIQIKFNLSSLQQCKPKKHVILIVHIKAATLGLCNAIGLCTNICAAARGIRDAPRSFPCSANAPTQTSDTHWRPVSSKIPTELHLRNLGSSVRIGPSQTVNRHSRLLGRNTLLSPVPSRPVLSCH